jgi:hypothetical protein
MAFTVPLDDTRTQVGRLSARQKGPFPTLYVEPAPSAFQDEWDAYDQFGDYVGTYTTRELTRVKGKGLQTVLNRFSDHPWSFLQDKPRKKRTRRGGRKNGSAATRQS